MNCYLDTLQHTLSLLRVMSCCHTSKSKLSKVSSNIRSPEQTFFSFDDFLKPLKLAVVTVFSHFVLAPRTPSRTPASTTRENRLKNIFTILFLNFFLCCSLSLLMLLICLMDRVKLYDVPSISLSGFIQFHYLTEVRKIFFITLYQNLLCSLDDKFQSSVENEL